jgi:hypothetical protein
MKLRCPSCRNAFRWDTSEGWPRFCPLCSFDTSMDDNPEVAAPHVSDGRAKAMLKSADQTFNQYAAATANNAREAASILGVSESDTASLKVTDFETGLRQGDLAVKAPVNDVTRFMDAHPQNVAALNASAMAAAASAHTGRDAYAGGGAMSTIRALHAETGQDRVVASQTGLKGSAPAIQPMNSEIPPLELHNRVMATGKGKRTF